MVATASTAIVRWKRRFSNSRIVCSPTLVSSVRSLCPARALPPSKRKPQYTLLRQNELPRTRGRHLVRWLAASAGRLAVVYPRKWRTVEPRLCIKCTTFLRPCKKLYLGELAEAMRWYRLAAEQGAYFAFNKPRVMHFTAMVSRRSMYRRIYGSTFRPHEHPMRAGRGRPKLET